MAKSVTYMGGVGTSKGKDTSTGVCAEQECKEKGTRLNFCSRHFKEFKFGVIKKNGVRPTDYASKLTAYEKANKK